MAIVSAWFAWHLLGQVAPEASLSPLENAQDRVLVRMTDRSARGLAGVHFFDEHADQQLGWTYRNRFEELFARGAPLEMHDETLESKIDAQRRRLNFRPRALAHQWLDNPQIWLSDYRKQEEINQALRDAASRREDLELENLGESVMGRSILGLTVKGRGALAQQRILVLGTQHAREWLSTMSCMSLLSAWIHVPKNSHNRPTLTVVPVVNPDGYAYSWEHDRLWRKNRRPASSGEAGVDLNRNWGQSWGDEHGSSPHASSDAYHGTHAFSEPETRAVRDFVQRKGDLKAVLDVHTFGQWVIYPASCKDPVSWGHSSFATLARQIAERISQSTGVPYSAIGGTDFSYPACGDAADWFAEQRRVYSLTLELRPETSAGRRGFIQPPSAIQPTASDLIAAVEGLESWLRGEAISGPTLSAQGPGDNEEGASLCSVGPDSGDPALSLGALCCLSVLGRKRSAQNVKTSSTTPPSPHEGAMCVGQSQE